MATYKGHFNFDTGDIQPGDIFIGCNPSKMEGRVIPVDNLTFKKCNLFGVAENATWTIEDCAHYGRTAADLPTPPTEQEIEEQEIDQVLDRLGELTLKRPDYVSAGIKNRQSLERFNQVMSADGKPVKVESLDGKWS
jgi:hypothetical protein